MPRISRSPGRACRPRPRAGFVVGALPRLTPCMPSSRMMFITWSRPPPRIPALHQQLGVDLPVSVHGHEEIRMDRDDVPGQRLVARLHATWRPAPEHAVAARREKPAIQQSGQDPADRPGPETVPEFVDVRDHQGRVRSSLAAKKADAVVRISFARRSSAFSARRRLSSAIASSADSFDPAAAVASCASRHRRSDSVDTPRSPATAAIALVSDEYDRPGLRQQPDGLPPELVRISRDLCHDSIISHPIRGNTEQKPGHINRTLSPCYIVDS